MRKRRLTTLVSVVEIRMAPHFWNAKTAVKADLSFRQLPASYGCQKAKPRPGWREPSTWCFFGIHNVELRASTLDDEAGTTGGGSARRSQLD